MKIVHFIGAVNFARTRAAGGVLVVLGALLSKPASARPDGAACGERECSYGVSLELRERFATRRDFSRPVFLYQHPVEEVRGHELSLELELWLELLFDLGLELRLPLVTKHAVARYTPVQVSLDQATPAVVREASASGLADAEVLLDYRLFGGTWLAAVAGAGVRVPGDDNPGDASVPDRVPLGTGQRQWFVELTLAAALDPLFLELAYHGGYHPGDAASYLVRQLGDNQVASGVLGDFWSHELALEIAAGRSSRFWFDLTPSLKFDETPPLVQNGRELAFVRDRARFELGMRARAGARLSPSHALELFAEAPLTRAWERDPFFPIVLPARGFGVAWRISGP